VVAATCYSKLVSVVHPARSDTIRGDSGSIQHVVSSAGWFSSRHPPLYNSGDSDVIYNKCWLVVVQSTTLGTIQHVEASSGDVFIPIIQYMVTALPTARGEGTTLGCI
jgi:hypothetical protein